MSPKDAELEENQRLKEENKWLKDIIAKNISDLVEQISSFKNLFVKLFLFPITFQKSKLTNLDEFYFRSALYIMTNYPGAAQVLVRIHSQEIRVHVLIDITLCSTIH